MYNLCNMMNSNKKNIEQDIFNKFLKINQQRKFMDKKYNKDNLKYSRNSLMNRVDIENLKYNYHNLMNIFNRFLKINQQRKFMDKKYHKHYYSSGNIKKNIKYILKSNLDIINNQIHKLNIFLYENFFYIHFHS